MTLQGHMELRIHRTVWDPMEQKVHCDTVGPDGIMETTVTLWGVMEPRGHCDTAGPHGAKGPL